jgi:Collagen triple helix repeat (20 copies)
LKRFRFRPTYSNVVATLALFFALAGGAWAATQLPKGSVGSTQLAKGAVTPEKLSAQAKKGFTGPAGPQGALGPRGNDGQPGANGASGATGSQGIRGATGATGATGARGELGEHGLRGEQGPMGDIGPEGPRGLEGPRGFEGQRGLEGPQGPEGKAGPEGQPGLEGKQGPEGQQGLEGKQGAEGVAGPTGPSDAYFDVTEPGAEQVGHEARVVLEVTNLPAGEYVLQAAFTLEGITEPAIAECKFVGGSGITVGTAEPFSTNVTPGNFVSLAGMGTAVAAGPEPGTVSVICGTAATGNFIIPPESGHLTVTKVGTLHPQAP